MNLLAGLEEQLNWNSLSLALVSHNSRCWGAYRLVFKLICSCSDLSLSRHDCLHMVKRSLYKSTIANWNRTCEQCTVECSERESVRLLRTNLWRCSRQREQWSNASTLSKAGHKVLIADSPFYERRKSIVMFKFGAKASSPDPLVS